MELGPVATLELWEETLARIAGLVREQRTTLVFVNTRRLVERVAHQLSQKIGEEKVVAHHGSLSRKTRLEGGSTAEVRRRPSVCGDRLARAGHRYRRGGPRLPDRLSPLDRCAAAASGPIGSPAGRHSQRPLFPLTRDELIECTALIYAVPQRRIRPDSPFLPGPWTFSRNRSSAMCAAEDGRSRICFRLSAGPTPTLDLPRELFDRVVQCSRKDLRQTWTQIGLSPP